MELLLKKLLGLLEHATELYQSLHVVVQQEKDAVVGLNLHQLNQACKSKDNLLLKLRILEEQREQLVYKLASDLNCSPQKISLTRLSEWVEEPYASMLHERSTDLLSLIQNLQAANQQNKALLSHSLELIHGSYNLLNNAIAASPVYYRKGEVQNNRQTGKLVCGDI
jgi:flagellar biosynthesis/type III secretory pathway chaperone